MRFLACLSLLVALGCSSSGNNNCGMAGACTTAGECTTAGSACVKTHPDDCAGSCLAVGGSSSSCSGSNGTETCVEAISIKAGGAGCPLAPSTLVGTKAAGASCTTGKDCAPTCCACPNGNPLLAAECTGGTCAAGQDACASAQAACPH